MFFQVPVYPGYPGQRAIKRIVIVVEGDINKAGDKVLVARGGDGGMISNQFVGQKGDALSVTLDLKVISDIGFVGYVICRSLFD